MAHDVCGRHRIVRDGYGRIVVRLAAHGRRRIAAATLRERSHVARQPVILMTLLVTTLWAMGAYTIYTFLAPFIAKTTPLHGARLAMSYSRGASRRRLVCSSAARLWIALARAA